MLSSPRRHRLALLTVAAAAVTAAAGCSGNGAERPAPGTPDSAGDHSAASSSEGPTGLSAAGVTTRIDIPAQSTEEQYAQACMHAKDWMAAKGGDPDTLVEPYLMEVQSATQAGPGAFGKTWPQLSEAQQAAVIIAVRAAADGGC